MRHSTSYPRRYSSLSTFNNMSPLCLEQALETRTVQCVNTTNLLKRMKGLKKIKRKMGLSSRLTTFQQIPPPPLLFNEVCGENNRISHEGRTLRRVQSFCKGVAFSNRPVKVNEKVCIRLLEVSSNWSGVLRFGFTNVDPESLRGCLPKYLCPDLTGRPGYWAKALSERHGTQGCILFFYVTSAGDIIYGIDHVEMGVFISGVETRNPLWVALDVYGNSTSLQFVDQRALMNNGDDQIRTSNGAMSNRTVPAQPITPYLSSTLPEETVNIPGFGNLSISDPTVIRAIAHRSTHDALPLIVHQNVAFSPLSFHTIKGPNVSFTDRNRTIAHRKLNEYSKGYVFTSRPLRVNEKIVIQVLSNEPHYVGAMSFGVTSADPSILNDSDFPEDCDELLDRSEYWVVCKDVAASPKAGDELSFTYSSDGQITFAKNNGSPHVIMHVDSSIKLYAFFDLFGHTSKIRVLGSVRVTDPARSMQQQHQELLRRLEIEAPQTWREMSQHSSGDIEREANRGKAEIVAFAATTIEKIDNILFESSSSPTRNNSSSSNNSTPRAVATNDSSARSFSRSSARNLSFSGPKERTECSVCYENPVDSVLYSCGHMCMCFECAQRQWKRRRGGMCPICRAVIIDVIKIYRA